MNFALQNTLELVLVIGLGLLLQKKIAKQDLKGVKTVILSVALPAVIFVALLKIKLESSLLIFPVLALAFNLILCSWPPNTCSPARSPRPTVPRNAPPICYYLPWPPGCHASRLSSFTSVTTRWPLPPWPM